MKFISHFSTQPSTQFLFQQRPALGRTNETVTAAPEASLDFNGSFQDFKESLFSEQENQALINSTEDEATQKELALRTQANVTTEFFDLVAADFQEKFKGNYRFLIPSLTDSNVKNEIEINSDSDFISLSDVEMFDVLKYAIKRDVYPASAFDVYATTAATNATLRALNGEAIQLAIQPSSPEALQDIAGASALEDLYFAEGGQQDAEFERLSDDVTPVKSLREASQFGRKYIQDAVSIYSHEENDTVYALNGEEYADPVDFGVALKKNLEASIKEKYSTMLDEKSIRTYKPSAVALAAAKMQVYLALKGNGEEPAVFEAVMQELSTPNFYDKYRPLKRIQGYPKEVVDFLRSQPLISSTDEATKAQTSNKTKVADYPTLQDALYEAAGGQKINWLGQANYSNGMLPFDVNDFSESHVKNMIEPVTYADVANDQVKLVWFTEITAPYRALTGALVEDCLYVDMMKASECGTVAGDRSNTGLGEGNTDFLVGSPDEAFSPPTFVVPPENNPDLPFTKGNLTDDVSIPQEMQDQVANNQEQAEKFTEGRTAEELVPMVQDLYERLGFDVETMDIKAENVQQMLKALPEQVQDFMSDDARETTELHSNVAMALYDFYNPRFKGGVVGLAKEGFNIGIDSKTSIPKIGKKLTKYAENLDLGGSDGEKSWTEVFEAAHSAKAAELSAANPKWGPRKVKRKATEDVNQLAKLAINFMHVQKEQIDNPHTLVSGEKLAFDAKAAFIGYTNIGFPPGMDTNRMFDNDDAKKSLAKILTSAGTALLVPVLLPVKVAKAVAVDVVGVRNGRTENMHAVNYDAVQDAINGKTYTEQLKDKTEAFQQLVAYVQEAIKDPNMSPEAKQELAGALSDAMAANANDVAVLDVDAVGNKKGYIKNARKAIRKNDKAFDKEVKDTKPRKFLGRIGYNALKKVSDVFEEISPFTNEESDLNSITYSSEDGASNFEYSADATKTVNDALMQQYGALWVDFRQEVSEMANMMYGPRRLGKWGKELQKLVATLGEMEEAYNEKDYATFESKIDEIKEQMNTNGEMLALVSLDPDSQIPVQIPIKKNIVVKWDKDTGEAKIQRAKKKRFFAKVLGRRMFKTENEYKDLKSDKREERLEKKYGQQMEAMSRIHAPLDTSADYWTDVKRGLSLTEAEMRADGAQPTLDEFTAALGQAMAQMNKWKEKTDDDGNGTGEFEGGGLSDFFMMIDPLKHPQLHSHVQDKIEDGVGYHNFRRNEYAEGLTASYRSLEKFTWQAENIGETERTSMLNKPFLKDIETGVEGAIENYKVFSTLDQFKGKDGFQKMTGLTLIEGSAEEYIIESFYGERYALVNENNPTNKAKRVAELKYLVKSIQEKDIVLQRTRINEDGGKTQIDITINPDFVDGLLGDFDAVKRYNKEYWNTVQPTEGLKPMQNTTVANAFGSSVLPILEVKGTDLDRPLTPIESLAIAIQLQNETTKYNGETMTPMQAYAQVLADQFNIVGLTPEILEEAITNDAELLSYASITSAEWVGDNMNTKDESLQFTALVDQLIEGSPLIKVTVEIEAAANEGGKSGISRKEITLLLDPNCTNFVATGETAAVHYEDAETTGYLAANAIAQNGHTMITAAVRIENIVENMQSFTTTKGFNNLVESQFGIPSSDTNVITHVITENADGGVSVVSTLVSTGEMVTNTLPEELVGLVGDGGDVFVQEAITEIINREATMPLQELAVALATGELVRGTDRGKTKDKKTGFNAGTQTQLSTEGLYDTEVQAEEGPE